MSKYRIVPCPREGFPGAVMIEMFGPDPDAAAKSGVYFAPRETWPKGWLPLHWHASIEDAKVAAMRNLEHERAEIEKHRERLAARSDIEILA